ncbi:MAG TPA: trypsin-like peptidase domain-containing protein [Nocardioidaceae bacterium]|nr:trypsin-like peptidase domain-containing protein [Nocardioidaceae bacterium]
MTEQNPFAEQDRFEADHTSPIATYASPPSYGPTQPQPWSVPTVTRTGSRVSKATVAALLVGALTVGGVAGAAGAAGVLALDDDTPTTSVTGTNSPVIANEDDTAAPAGSVEQVAQQVLPSVVKINVTGQGGSGSGSGIIISSDGVILTNNHVVEVAANGGSLAVSFNDGSTARATIVGTDPVTDLAVIKAEGVDGLTPAALNSSETLDVGEQVVAIGSPFGLQATVTSGIVSALNRPVSVGESQTGSDTTYPAIQTDAAINPGNSGGPLVNMAGEVVGINSSIRTASSGLGSEGGSIGLGFAIPISKVLPIVEQLRNGETPTHARMGVNVSNATSSDGLVPGAEIQAVEEGSAAAEAGIEAGDVVTKVGDDLITGSESLVATIRGLRPGDTVTVTVLRGGEEMQFDVVLDSDEGVVSR